MSSHSRKEKDKYTVPVPSSNQPSTPRRPTPGAAPLDQIKNPVFASPAPVSTPKNNNSDNNNNLGAAQKKKHRSSNRHHKKHTRPKPASSLWRTLRSMFIKLTLAYTLYAYLFICPVTPDASLLCKPLASAHLAVISTVMPLYDVSVRPYVEPYILKSEPYVLMTQKAYRTYGQPVVKVIGQAANKGSDLYWAQAHPLVIHAYDSTVKPAFDLCAGTFREKYTAFVEPGLNTVKNLAGKAYEVNAEYVQPHISRGVEFAKPYARTAGKVTVTYYILYVEPAVRLASNTTTKFWRSKVSPFVDTVWVERVVPTSKGLRKAFHEFLVEDDVFVEESNQAGEWLKGFLTGIRIALRSTLKKTVIGWAWLAEKVADQDKELKVTLEDEGQDLKALVQVELDDLDLWVGREVADLANKTHHIYHDLFENKFKAIVEKRQEEAYGLLHSEKNKFETDTVPAVKSDRTLDAAARKKKIDDLVEVSCENMSETGRKYETTLGEILNSIIAEIDGDIKVVENSVANKIAIGRHLIEQNSADVKPAVVHEIEVQVSKAAAKAGQLIGAAVAKARQIESDINSFRRQKQEVLDDVIKAAQKSVRETAIKERETLIEWVKNNAKEAVGKMTDSVKDKVNENAAHVTEEFEAIQENVDGAVSKAAEAGASAASAAVGNEEIIVDGMS